MTIRGNNNFAAQVAVTVRPGDTTINVKNVQNLPGNFSNGSDTAFIQTVALNAGGTQSVMEYMLVTAINGNVWTVLRAQEGSTAQTIHVNTAITGRITWGLVANLIGGGSGTFTGGIVTGETTFAPSSGTPATFSAPAGYAQQKLTPGAQTGPPTGQTYAAGHIAWDHKNRIYMYDGTRWLDLGVFNARSVNAFGAVPDGSTDSLAAVQAAINDLATTGGGFIEFEGDASMLDFAFSNGQLYTPNDGLPANTPAGSGAAARPFIFRGKGAGAGGSNSGKIRLNTPFDGTLGSAYAGDYAWIGGGEVIVANPGTDTLLLVPDQTACINSKTPVVVTGNSAYDVSGLSDGIYHLHLDPTDGVQVSTVWQWYTHGAGFQANSTSIRPTAIWIADFEVFNGSIRYDDSRPRIKQQRGMLGFVDARGAGVLGFENIEIVNTGSQTKNVAALIKTTNAYVYFKNVTVGGPIALGANGYPIMTGIQLGGPGSPFTTVPTAPDNCTAYSGTQSSETMRVEGVTFRNLHTPFEAAADCNTVYMVGCEFAGSCGSKKGGAINVRGGNGNYFLGNTIQANVFAFPENVESGSRNTFDNSSWDSTFENLTASMTAGVSTSVQFSLARSIVKNPLAIQGAYIGAAPIGSHPTSDSWELLYLQEPNQVGASGGIVAVTGTNVANGGVTQTGSAGPLTLAGSGVASGSYLVGTTAATQEWVTVTVVGTTATVTRASDALGNVLTNGATNHPHNGHALQSGPYNFPLARMPKYSYTTSSFVSLTAAHAFDGNWAPPNGSVNAFKSRFGFDDLPITKDVYNISEGYGVLNSSWNNVGDGVLIDNPGRYRNTAFGAEWPGGIVVAKSPPLSDGSNQRGHASAKYWAAITVGDGGAGPSDGVGRSTATITNMVWHPTPKLVQVTAANSFIAGQKVLITGVTPNDFNGVYRIVMANATGFSYYANYSSSWSRTYTSGGVATVGMGYVSASNFGAIIGGSVCWPSGTGYLIELYDGLTGSLLMSVDGHGNLQLAGTLPTHAAQHEPGASDDIYEMSGMYSSTRAENLPSLRFASSNNQIVPGTPTYFLFKAKSSFTASYLLGIVNTVASGAVTLAQMGLFTVTSVSAPLFGKGTTSMAYVAGTSPTAVSSGAGLFGATGVAYGALAVGSDNSTSLTSVGITAANNAFDVSTLAGAGVLTLDASASGFLAATSAEPQAVTIPTANGPAVVTYTGKSGSTITGCQVRNGSTGTVSTGACVQQTYSIVAGQMYAIGFLQVGGTGVKLQGSTAATGAMMTLSPMMSTTGSTLQTSMPLSQALGSLGSVTYASWVAVAQDML